MIKLLATDLDGTLVRNDNTVSEASRRAITAALDAGFEIVLVTGRPTRWLWEVADAVGYGGIVVAANGAVTFDLATQTVLDQRLLSSETLTATTSTLRRAFPEVYFGIDSGDEFAYEPGYVHDWQITPVKGRDGQLHSPAEMGDLATIIQRPCVKLLARIHGGDPDAFLAHANELLGEDVCVTHSAHSALLEISAADVTKATGLERYCRRLGIERAEVAAVGDMPNDIPMLQWAGASFAVANAHPTVKRAAEEVLSESNDEDAVAVLIHRLLVDHHADALTRPERPR